MSNNQPVPGVVVGIGSEVPEGAEPGHFRERTGITGRFALYIGRIDENKGCDELFDYFAQYAAGRPPGTRPGPDRQPGHGRSVASAH